MNTAVATKIAGDKAATSAVLALRGIPNVEHVVFHRPGSPLWLAERDDAASMIRSFEKYRQDIVCKPNDGKRGRDVFRVRSSDELQIAVHRIFTDAKVLAISPFFEYEHEYRCVVLRGRVELVVRKTLRMLPGDGKRTRAEICLDACLRRDISVDVFTESILRDEMWRCVPERGELFAVDWQHNVGRGALVTIVEEGYEEVAPIREIAIAAAGALSIDFATVDVIERSGYLAIIEVNSVVSLESIAAQLPKARSAINRMYGRAITLLFGD